MEEIIGHGKIVVEVQDDVQRQLARIEAQYDRAMEKLSRKEAELTINANDREFVAKYRKAEADLAKWRGKKAEATIEVDTRKANAGIASATARLKKLEAANVKLANKLKDLEGQRATLNERTTAKIERQETRLQKAIQKEADDTAKAQADAAKARQAQHEKVAKAIAAAEEKANKERIKAEEKRITAGKKLRDQEVADENKRIAAAVKANADANKAREKQAADTAKAIAAAETKAEKARISEASKNARASQRVRDKELREETSRIAAATKARMAAASKAAASEERDLRNLGNLTVQYMNMQERRAKMEKRRSAVFIDERVRTKIDFNMHQLDMDIAEVRARLEAIGHPPPEVDIEVNKKGSASLANWAKSLSGATIRLGPFTTSIGGAIRALTLLGPIVTGLVGALGALAGAIGAGLVGAVGIGSAALAGFIPLLGGTFLAIKPVINGLKAASKAHAAYTKAVQQYGQHSKQADAALKKFNNTLKSLPKGTEQAWKEVQNFRTEWEKATGPAARRDFGKLVQDVAKAGTATLPMAARQTSRFMDNLTAGLGKWLQGLRGAEAQGILSRLFTNANKSLQPILSGLGHLLAAFGRVTAAFSDHLPQLTRDFNAWAAAVDKSSQNTSGVGRNVNMLVRAFRGTLHVIASATSLLAAFFAVSADKGGGISFLNRIAGGMDRITANIRRNPDGLAAFFRGSIDTTEKLYGVLKPIAQVFIEWSTIMRPFTNIMLQAASAIAAVIDDLAKFKGTRALLTAGFGIFLAGALLSKLAATGKALTEIYSTLKAIGALRLTGGVVEALSGGLIPGGKFGRKGAKGVAGAATSTARKGVTSSIIRTGTTVAGGAVVGAGTEAAGGAALAAGGIGLGAAAGIAAAVAIPVVGTIVAIHLSNKAAAEARARMEAAARVSAKVTVEDQGLRTGNAAGAIDARIAKLNQLKKAAEAATQAQRPAGRGAVTLRPDLSRYNAEIGALQRLKNSMDVVRRGTVITSTSFQTMRDTTVGHLKDIRTYTAGAMRQIRREIDTNSDAGREALSNNFRAAARQVRISMNQGLISTQTGLREINSLMRKSLAEYGMNVPGKIPGSNTTVNQYGQVHGGATTTDRKPNRKATGGWIGMPGEAGGDTEVALLGRGEAVLNRHQQAYVNEALASTYGMNLDGLFNKVKTPHYLARGGRAVRDGIQRFASGGIVQAGRALQRMGYSVSENPAFGGVSGVHVPGSYHYKGLAVDVNADGKPGGEVSWLNRAKSWLLQNYRDKILELLWQVPGHFDHLHVAIGGAGVKGLGAFGTKFKLPKVNAKGVHGDMGGIAQGVLNRVHAAAQHKGQKMLDAMQNAEGGEFSGGPTGGDAAKNMAIGRRMMLGMGWDASQWPFLKMLWNKESGWNSNAVNKSSGAAGIPQALGHGHVFNLGDAVAQIRWGLRYIKSTYGAPSRAWAHEQKANWYARGRPGHAKGHVAPAPPPATVAHKNHNKGANGKVGAGSGPHQGKHHMLPGYVHFANNTIDETTAHDRMVKSREFYQKRKSSIESYDRQLGGLRRKPVLDTARPAPPVGRGKHGQVTPAQKEGYRRSLAAWKVNSQNRHQVHSGQIGDIERKRDRLVKGVKRKNGTWELRPLSMIEKAYHRDNDMYQFVHKYKKTLDDSEASANREADFMTAADTTNNEASYLAHRTKRLTALKTARGILAKLVPQLSGEDQQNAKLALAQADADISTTGSTDSTATQAATQATQDATTAIGDALRTQQETYGWSALTGPTDPDKELANLQLGVSAATLDDVPDDPTTPNVREDLATLADNIIAADNLAGFWQRAMTAIKATGGSPAALSNAITEFTTARGAATDMRSQINQGALDAAAQVASDQTNYGSARLDLYRTLGSNFSPAVAALSPPSLSPGAFGVNAASQSQPSGPQKIVTIHNTNHFEAPPPDPHTWSQGVAWELRAAA